MAEMHSIAVPVADMRRETVVQQYRINQASTAKRILPGILGSSSQLTHKVANMVIDAFPTATLEGHRHCLNLIDAAAHAMRDQLTPDELLNKDDIDKGTRAARRALTQAGIQVKTRAVNAARVPLAV